MDVTYWALRDNKTGLLLGCDVYSDIIGDGVAINNYKLTKNEKTPLWVVRNKLEDA